MENEKNSSILHPFARTKIAEMKAFLKGATVLMVTAAVFLCFSLFPQAAKAITAYGQNLVINGNAQASDSNGAPAGWNPGSSEIMVLTLESGLIAFPYSLDGGNVFDYWPIGNGITSIYQIIDFSILASDIDVGAVNIHVSAESRKNASNSSNAIQLTLLDASNNTLGIYTAIGTKADESWEMLTINRDSIDSRTRKVQMILTAAISTETTGSDYVQFDGVSLTLTKSITSAGVSGIAAPVMGEIPTSIASLAPLSSDYIVSGLTWENGDGSPANLINGKFRAGKTYKAVVELAAGPTCKFTSGTTLSVDTGTPQLDTVFGNTEGNRLTYTITFPATTPLAANGITVDTQPDDLTYVEGESLNLAGLAATLTYNDASEETVDFAQFGIKGITAVPANGTALSVAAHNGQTVALSANGQTVYTNPLTVVAAIYTITASPSPLNFSSLFEGYTSAPAAQTVTITNKGNSYVTLTQPTGTDYVLGALSTTGLGAGASATFTVQPKTGLSAGTHSGTITVNTDHGTSANVNVAFTVDAATYTITASPSSLDFGSDVEGYPPVPASQTVTVTNTGNSTVTIPSAPTAASYDITGTFPMTLVSGGTSTFTVKPKYGLAAGPHNQTITLSTNHGTSAGTDVAFTVDAATYTLTANPSSLNFGSVMEGYSSAPAIQKVTVTNTGNTPMLIIVTDPANYSISQTTTIFVPGIPYTFYVHPMPGLAAGVYNETITFSSVEGTIASVDVAFTVNAATYTITASPSSLDFGSAVEGYTAVPASQTVTVTNTGNSTVTIPSAPTAAGYDITGTFPMTLVSGGTGTFTVKPKLWLAAGLHHETIILSTGSSTSASVDVTFTVQAASYAVEADTHNLSFGSAVEGYTLVPTAQTVIITNAGNKDVTLTTPLSTRFDITALDALTLTPAASARFTVKPKAGLSAGTYNETIAFGTTSATSDSVDISFTVQSASFAITASPFTINFASSAEGYPPPAAKTITVVNTGNQPVTLNQPVSTNFTVGTLSTLSIAPLEEAAFTLQPKIGLTEGSYTETIVLQGSNGAQANVEVRFAVTAAPSYLISASPSSMDFGSLAEGYIQPAVQTVTVTNTGNQSISLYQPAASHFVIGVLSKTALAPGDTAAFTVTPKKGLSTGAWNETIQIIGSQGVNARVDAAFTCTAPIDYYILSGDGSTFQQNDPNPSSLTIRANGDIRKFTGLMLNGERVDESNYDVTEGSTIVTLHQDFLNTLQPGTYTLRFQYTDGYAEAGFVVQDPMPVTGDNDALLLFGALMILSLAAIILLKRMKAWR